VDRCLSEYTAGSQDRRCDSGEYGKLFVLTLQTYCCVSFFFNYLDRAALANA
jgi:hypothetical protein